MKQYEYRLTKYLAMMENENRVIITPEHYALQKWHPCYMDYLQPDGAMTKRPPPLQYSQNEEDEAYTNDYKLDPQRTLYTEADEQFFTAYDAPTRYADDLGSVERIRQNDHLEFVIRMRLRTMLPLSQNTKDITTDNWMIDYVTGELLKYRNQNLIQCLQSHNLLWQEISALYRQSQQILNQPDTTDNGNE